MVGGVISQSQKCYYWYHKEVKLHKKRNLIEDIMAVSNFHHHTFHLLTKLPVFFFFNSWFNILPKFDYMAVMFLLFHVKKEAVPHCTLSSAQVGCFSAQSHAIDFIKLFSYDLGT